MRKFQRKKALTAIVAAALIWSSSAAVIKCSTLSPNALGTLRSIFAAAFLFVYLVKFERLSFQIRRSSAFWCTVLATAVNSHLVVQSMRFSTAANAVLLLYTAPIWVLFLSAFFARTLPTIRDCIAVVGVILGLVVFFSEQVSANSTTGVSLGLLSGLFYGILILSLRALTIPDRFRSLVLGYLLATLCGLVIPGTLADIGSMQLGAGDVLAPAYLGGIVLGFAYVLFGKAVGVVSATEASLIPFIEPILSPVWVALIYGEQLTIRGVIGGIIVIGFLIFKAWPTSDSRPEN